MNVHQILSGAGRHDAITNEARMFRSYFRRWGWGGRDYAARIAPGMNGEIAQLGQLRVRDEDVLLLHHSAAAPGLSELLALPNSKLLLYHNITPPEWLWDHAPLVAVQCALGRQQLPELVAAADVAAADSEFNAAELQRLGVDRTQVIPILVDPLRLGEQREMPDGGPPLADADADADADAHAPTVLFVGRLSPHKRQDDVIRAFGLFRRHHAPDARLILVGDPITTAYALQLQDLADRVAPGAVTVESGLTGPQLAARYRSADVFLCLSAHEGFCIPLLEAFHFGIPVIARPAGAVPETVGDAALLVEDPDLAVVAELLHLALNDRELRVELRRRGQARLRAFAPDVVAARLRATVEATVASRRGSTG